MGYPLKKILASLPPGPRPPPPIFIGVAEPLVRTQDYFTNKVCSVGKSDRRRYVTQGNPLRSFEGGFMIGYFPNIYDDFCKFSCFSLDNEDRNF